MYKRKNNFKEHMNIKSILQVLCPPQEQFLLWVSLWGLVCAAQGAAVQAVLGMRCRPCREGSDSRRGFLLENSQAGPSCGQGTPQHLHSIVSLTYLINTSPHMKQEISCALEKTRLDLMQERAESHSHCCLMLHCWLGNGVMLPFHLFASEEINRLVLPDALVNIKSLVPISLGMCHKSPKYEKRILYSPDCRIVPPLLQTG